MTTQQQVWINRVREAIKVRGIWFYLLYQSFCEEFPTQIVEQQMRKAIFRYGQMKATNDGSNMTPEKWVTGHVSKGSSLYFDSDIEINAEHAIQKMKQCPLVESWKELGCTPEEIRLLCDIAAEGDYGRAKGHQLNLEISECLAKGDTCCLLKLTKS